MKRYFYLFFIVILLMFILCSCSKENPCGHPGESFTYAMVCHDPALCFDKKKGNANFDIYLISTQFGVYQYNVYHLDNRTVIPTVGFTYESTYYMKTYECGYKEITQLYLTGLYSKE